MGNYFWLVVVPNLDCFLGTLGIIGIVACILGGFIYLTKKLEAYNEEQHENAWKFAKTMLKMFAASMTIFFITCFIPSKKDIILLKIISVVHELKGIDQIPQKLIERLNDFLEEDKKNY